MGSKNCASGGQCAASNKLHASSSAVRTHRQADTPCNLMDDDEIIYYARDSRYEYAVLRAIMNGVSHGAQWDALMRRW